jgi:hypothetical protein
VCSPAAESLHVTANTLRFANELRGVENYVLHNNSSFDHTNPKEVEAMGFSFQALTQAIRDIQREHDVSHGADLAAVPPLTLPSAVKVRARPASTKEPSTPKSYIFREFQALERELKTNKEFLSKVRGVHPVDSTPATVSVFTHVYTMPAPCIKRSDTVLASVNLAGICARKHLHP